MEENLEISKSKFFLSFSLSEKKKERRNSLSLFPLSLSLRLRFLSFVQRRCVLSARTERERERGMICARRFVSLFKKCFSLVVGGVGFLKKKSDECNFHLNSPVEKKRKFFRIYEYSTVPRDQHTCA